MSGALTSLQQEAIRGEIFAGRKIDATKFHREFMGSSLAQAKDFVDELERELRATSPELFARLGKSNFAGVFMMPAALAALFAVFGGTLGGCAHLQGRDEAIQEVKEHRATIYVYGLRRIDEDLDRETGLPYESIGGCIVVDDEGGRANGHNDYIHHLIAREGPLPESRKQWESQLFDLSGYFAAQGAPILLPLDGEPVSDGLGHSITVRSENAQYPDMKRVGLVQIVITHSTSRARTIDGPLAIRGRPLEMHWGPPGADVAVLRYDRGDRRPDERFAALDLRTGAWLRSELCLP